MEEPLPMSESPIGKSSTSRHPTMASPTQISELPRHSVRSPPRVKGTESKRRTLPLPSRHLSLSPDIHPREDSPKLVAVGRRTRFVVEPHSPPVVRWSGHGERLRSQLSAPHGSSSHRHSDTHTQELQLQQRPTCTKPSQRRSSDSHRVAEVEDEEAAGGAGDLSPRLTAGFLVTAVVPGTRGTSYEEELESRLSQVRVSAQIWRQRAIFERSRRKELEDEFEVMERGYRTAVQEQQIASERKYERLKNKTRLLMRRCEQLRSERSELECKYSAEVDASVQDKQKFEAEISNLSAELANLREKSGDDLSRRQYEYTAWLSHYRLLLGVALDKIKLLETSRSLSVVSQPGVGAYIENKHIEKSELVRSRSCPNQLNEISLSQFRMLCMRRKSVSNEDVRQLKTVPTIETTERHEKLEGEEMEQVNTAPSRSSLRFQLASKYFELSKSIIGSKLNSSCETMKPGNNTASSSLASLSRRRPGSTGAVRTLSDGYVSEESDGWKGKIKKRKGKKQSKYKHRSLDRSNERGYIRHLDGGLLGQSALDLTPARPMSLHQPRGRKTDRTGNGPQLELLRRFHFGSFVSQLGSSSRVGPQESGTESSRDSELTQSASSISHPETSCNVNQAESKSTESWCDRRSIREDVKVGDDITSQVTTFTESFDGDLTKHDEAGDAAAISYDVSTGRNSVGDNQSRFERLRERRNGLAELPQVRTGSVKSVSRSKLDQLAKSIKTYLH